MTENTDASNPEQTESTSSEVSLRADGDTRVCGDADPRPPCDACDTTHCAELHDIRLGDEEYAVCGDCLQMLVGAVERYYWWERLTEAHFNQAVEFLRSLDEVWCVKDHAYAGGELWVHTPFCDAAVCKDVCDHYGFQIRWFSVIYPDDDGFDCVSDHGPCIEINLLFTNRTPDPLPLEYDIQEDVTYHEVEWIDDQHKLFGTND